VGDGVRERRKKSARDRKTRERKNDGERERK
jgi:hypothetical protein